MISFQYLKYSFTPIIAFSSFMVTCLSLSTADKTCCSCLTHTYSYKGSTLHNKALERGMESLEHIIIRIAFNLLANSSQR